MEPEVEILNRNISRPPSRRTRNTEMPIMQVMKSLDRPEGTIDLSQGIPFFGPPEEAVRDAVKETNRSHRYGPDAGDTDLREEIVGKLERENGIVGIGVDEVMVTAGANIGFLNTITSICDVGDNVILLDPFYFNHGMTLDILGVEHRHVGSTTGENFLEDLLVREIDDSTKAIVIVSPNNPTGEVMDRRSLDLIVDICLKNDLWLISDETYEKFCYESDHISPASLGADLPVISLFSFSKSHGMSGWRQGYMTYPGVLNDSLLKVQDTTVICPSRIGQRLALNCLRDHPSYTRNFLPELDRVRKRVIRWLKSHSGILSAPHPSGAFYSMPVFSTHDVNSMELATEILRDARVLLVPGRPFGMDAPPALRIAYGNVRYDQMDEALRRLDDWMDERSLYGDSEG
jgi:aspartate/methionine/tyrosine aminotransferase